MRIDTSEELKWRLAQCIWYMGSRNPRSGYCMKSRFHLWEVNRTCLRWVPILVPIPQTTGNIRSPHQRAMGPLSTVGRGAAAPRNYCFPHHVMEQVACTMESSLAPHECQVPTSILVVLPEIKEMNSMDLTSNTYWLEQRPIHLTSVGWQISPKPIIRLCYVRWDHFACFLIATSITLH